MLQLEWRQRVARTTRIAENISIGYITNRFESTKWMADWTNSNAGTETASAAASDEFVWWLSEKAFCHTTQYDKTDWSEVADVGMWPHEKRETARTT